MAETTHPSPLRLAQQRFQRGAFPTQGEPRRLDDLHLEAESLSVALARIGLTLLGTDLMVRQTRDGRDYMRICLRHGWLSREFYALTDQIGHMCPSCELELDADRGRIRYAELLKALSV